ncbi:hypothetical protein [Dactylosporangium sp. CA-092794]|uniref:hypothetical protein n=1 Tax=Dactylosporangium sp. CA-092794 TaxID=3239929 RepID=UPI003D89BCC7
MSATGGRWRTSTVTSASSATAAAARPGHAARVAGDHREDRQPGVVHPVAGRGGERGDQQHPQQPPVGEHRR